MESYSAFLERKLQLGAAHGFEPTYLPDFLFDFQSALTEFAIRKGRGAIWADCGLGKGQPRSAKVLTPTGWVAIGSLAVGDRVISSSGSASTVVGVYPKPEQDTYRVHFSDGASFVVDLDHLHICRTNNDRQRGRAWRVMSTQELRDCDNLRYGRDGKSRNYDIPIVGDVAFEGSELPIAPYLLGVLLGDGHLSGNVEITTADDEIRQRCASLLPAGVRLEQKDRYTWRIKTGANGNALHPFRQSLRDMGLLGMRSATKFVPMPYLFADAKSRLALLRGLMDTDGYISPEGCCQFYSASEQLVDAVIHLVRSLGGVPTKSDKATQCNGKKCLPCHIVTFSLATHNPFFVARKGYRWKAQPRDNGRWIDRLEYEGRQPTVCIAVDSPDASYVTEDFIVTHNTPMALVWAENVVRHTKGRVLILTPLAVGAQMLQEANKFGIEAHRSGDGRPKPNITIANYERLHLFNAADYTGVVCDESSAIKAFDGVRRALVTEFLRTIPYRLLDTATAAPNDYVELGTSSEALGEIGHVDMLNRFFKNDKNNSSMGRGFHGAANEWRFKPHAEQPFWRWVCSWARACRKPSDLGFDDARFILPPIEERETVVTARMVRQGYLFDLPAIGFHEEREVTRRTITERCEAAAEKVNGHYPGMVWCHLNDEGDLLEKLIPDAIQVSGRDSDEAKEEKFTAFKSGEARVLVIKPKIGAWGLNLEHCAHVVYFPSHSYEQYYQAVRRCWRFGQTRPVVVDIVRTDGDAAVLTNLQRKAAQADKMFSDLVAHMNDAIKLGRGREYDKAVEVPSWL